MPGPQTPDEALGWIREAIGASRYIQDPHFLNRCKQRRVGMADVRALLRGCRVEDVERYTEGTARAGGTNWRLRARDLDEVELVVGAEAFLDHLGQRVILLTVFG